MVAHLRNPEIASNDAIYNAVLACNSTRPVALKCVFEWLGLADTTIRIAHRFFYEFIDALQYFRMRLLPIEIFFPCFPREDEIHGSSFNFFRIPFPRSSDSIDFKSRFAFAGERNRWAVSWSDSYSESESITTDWSRLRVIITGALSSQTWLMVLARFSRASV
jgi:hypothetical protein